MEHVAGWIGVAAVVLGVAAGAQGLYRCAETVAEFPGRYDERRAEGHAYAVQRLEEMPAATADEVVCRLVEASGLPDEGDVEMNLFVVGRKAAMIANGCDPAPFAVVQAVADRYGFEIGIHSPTASECMTRAAFDHLTSVANVVEMMLGKLEIDAMDAALGAKALANDQPFMPARTTLNSLEPPVWSTERPQSRGCSAGTRGALRSR